MDVTIPATVPYHVQPDAKAIANLFKQRHRHLALGGFSLIKEKEIREAMLTNCCKCDGGNPPRAAAVFSVLKSMSHQTDFIQRDITLRPGALNVRAFTASDPEAGASFLRGILELSYGRAVWLELFEEDEIAREAVKRVGNFHYVTTKVRATAEIKGLYLANARVSLAPLSRADLATLVVLDLEFLSQDEHAAIKQELGAFAGWEQHYSVYNKQKSWTAFALRGYDDDPSFIIKPREMTKEWQEDNSARLNDKVRMTRAAASFPRALEVAARIAPPEGCDRIRFMRLRSGNGELARHTDIQDKTAGTKDGMMMRLHMPIVTNSDVEFNAWSARGKKLEFKFPERSLFYLDQRKPHCVINRNPEKDRIHFVIDFLASPALRDRLETAYDRR